MKTVELIVAPASVPPTSYPQEGWVYCFSNPYVWNETRDGTLLKIGMSSRPNLEDRLNEANGHTYSLKGWKVEFAKWVHDPMEKGYSML